MHILTRLFNSFTYRLRYLVCFAKPVANFAITVSDNNNGAKTEPPTAFNNFSNTVDKNNFFDELFLNPFFRSFKFSQETPPFDILNRLNFRI